MSGAPFPTRAQDLDGSGWDAVVVGAGPAGSISARALARAGRRVLLVERHALPREKVCGGCLHPRGLATLERLGLAPALAPSGARPLHSLSLACGGRRLALPADLGVAVPRATFDLELVRAARQAGVNVLSGWTARHAPGATTPKAPRRLQLVSRDGEPLGVTADLVIAADGLASPLMSGAVTGGPADPTSLLGAGALLPGDALPTRELEDGQVAMAVGAGGYVGRVRLPDGRVDLAAALSPGAVHAGVASAVADLLEQAHAPHSAAAAREAAWRTTPALTRRPTRASGPRLLAVGDAAGFVEPFTGEGMTWAAEGAELLGEVAARGWRPGLDEVWDRALRARLAASRRRCARLAAALRHPRLVSAALSALGLAPHLAARVLTAGHGTRRP